SEGEVGDMPAVQDVKAAVGEDERFAFFDQPVALDAHLVGGQDFGVGDGHVFLRRVGTAHHSSHSCPTGDGGRCPPYRCRSVSSCSIWLKSGMITPAPARINRVRLAGLCPKRRTSS